MRPLDTNSGGVHDRASAPITSIPSDASEPLPRIAGEVIVHCRIRLYLYYGYYRLLIISVILIYLVHEPYT